MTARIHTARCDGNVTAEVTVETVVEDHGIGIHLVGLSDAAVKESLLRTVAALQSAGYRIPGRRVLVNITPADLRKDGRGYDLPIAAGLIAASGQERLPLADRYLLAGELGPDGGVRNVDGASGICRMAQEQGLDGCILPAEAAHGVEGLTAIRVHGISSLADAVRILSGEEGR